MSGEIDVDPFESVSASSTQLDLDELETDSSVTDDIEADPFRDEADPFADEAEPVEIDEDGFATAELGFSLPEPPRESQPTPPESESLERPSARKKVAEYHKPLRSGFKSRKETKTGCEPSPVTTFVSGANKGPRIEFTEEELYLPETGGTAYKSLKCSEPTVGDLGIRPPK